MAHKLNSMRILDQRKIPYETLTYPDTIKDAMEVAEAIGAPYFQVYKTLIVEPIGADKPVVVLLACDRRLDMKKLAKATGTKKVRMAAHKDAERMTGLQVGGISALMLMDKNWTVYLDSIATGLEHIIISAGQRGTQLRVPTTPLMTTLRARLADVSTEGDDGDDEGE